LLRPTAEEASDRDVVAAVKRRIRTPQDYHFKSEMKSYLEVGYSTPDVVTFHMSED